MSDAPAIQGIAAAEPPSARRGHRSQTCAGSGGSARGRRVILLAALLAIANAFDLTFTLLARHHEIFHEVNPIVRSVIDSAAAVLAFKIGLAGFGLAVILRFRRVLLTEVLAWATCGVYLTLLVVWYHFFAVL